jgi:hypothetical protein
MKKYPQLFVLNEPSMFECTSHQKIVQIVTNVKAFLTALGNFSTVLAPSDRGLCCTIDILNNNRIYLLVSTPTPAFMK